MTHSTRFLPFLALLLASCARPLPVEPRPPPTPPGPVVPVDPPTPPKPPAAVASAENVAKVVVGMSFANAQLAVGVPATHDNVNDDGTRLVEWPAVNDAGAPVYLVAHFGRDGTVIGRVRIPRAK